MKKRDRDLAPPARVVVSPARNRAPPVPRCRRRDRSNTDHLRRAIALDRPSVLCACRIHTLHRARARRRAIDARSALWQSSANRRADAIARVLARAHRRWRTTAGHRRRHSHAHSSACPRPRSSHSSAFARAWMMMPGARRDVRRDATPGWSIDRWHRWHRSSIDRWHRWHRSSIDRWHRWHRSSIDRWHRWHRSTRSVVDRSIDAIGRRSVTS